MDEAVMHRADSGFIEVDGEKIWFCWQCGKQVADLGTGITPRHKGVINDYASRLYIYNRKGQVVGRVR